MNFYISDLHLYCRNQTAEGKNHDNRPFATLDEMHAYILQHWNSKVTNADTVYVLGDMSMRGKNDALIALVSQLKGKKVLVVGNHDDLSDYRYKQLYHEVCAYKELTENFGGKPYKVAMSHYPILCWNGQHRGTILLYGHTHNSVEETFFQQCISQMNGDEALSLRRQGGQHIRAINVGACMPYVDYEPRSLQELLQATEPKT